MAPYVLAEAKTSDSEAIASLFALSWASPFTQLQFGSVEPLALAAAMAPSIAQHMTNPQIRFTVMRNPETREVAAVAQWRLPADGVEEEVEETPEQKEERRKFDDEAYSNRLPENSNKGLIMEFTIGLGQLRDRTLSGSKHWRVEVLENIATHPDHRGQGLASRLIEWVFPQADEQGVLVYLDTASDNHAKRLYEKLGFEERGSQTIEDLSRYGGHGDHSHVALVRYPK